MWVGNRRKKTTSFYRRTSGYDLELEPGCGTASCHEGIGSSGADKADKGRGIHPRAKGQRNNGVGKSFWTETDAKTFKESEGLILSLFNTLLVAQTSEFVTHTIRMRLELHKMLFFDKDSFFSLKMSNNIKIGCDCAGTASTRPIRRLCTWTEEGRGLNVIYSFKQDISYVVS